MGRVPNEAAFAAGAEDSSPISKTKHVVADFRRRIVSGELRPGQRMPTWDTLEVEYKIGRPTLMRVLARLKQDGLVTADSTRGTFVAERPPHLYRYALVFPEGPGQPGWNRFWDGLDGDAANLQRTTPREIPCFYWTEPHPDNDSFLRLLREARSARLGGVIIVGGRTLAEASVIEQVALPAVLVQAEPSTTGSPTIYVDEDSFIEQSLGSLRAEGRRRPAIITNVIMSFERMMDRLAEYGLSSKPAWLQGVHTSHPWWAGQIVKLLLDPGQAERPDALIITDDNLADAAVAAIVELGLRVPQELSIVTHSNFTHPIAPVVPMLRLGYDTRKLLLLACDAIDALREHKPVPPRQLLKAEAVF